MAKAAFTAPKVARFKCPADKAQAFLWDSTSPGLGLRATPNGRPAYVFQAAYLGRDIRLTIGSPDDWSIPQAQAKARQYQREIDEGRDPRDLKRQARATKAAADAAKRRAELGSLQKLMDAYAASLGERQSAADARGLFRLHVTEAAPALAKAPAAAIAAEQFRDLLAKLIEAGKGRTAAKLRAYLRAAYGMAMRAGLDPTVPDTFSAFDVQVNQLERLPSLAQFSRALDRALTLPELRAFWKRLQAAPDGAARDAVTAALLLGGQRPAQLLRAVAADVDETAGTIMLRDTKGRNRAANPRRHVLPIVPELAPVIGRRRKLCKTPDAPLFSSAGAVALREETASELVGALCAAMAGAGELERGPFQMRDLRRTAETHMAALGISRDLRGQIQSHGLGGIQQRHYDRHDYLPEKRAALELWAQRLKSSPAGVALGSAPASTPPSEETAS